MITVYHQDECWEIRTGWNWEWFPLHFTIRASGAHRSLSFSSYKYNTRRLLFIYIHIFILTVDKSYDIMPSSGNILLICLKMNHSISDSAPRGTSEQNKLPLLPSDLWHRHWQQHSTIQSLPLPVLGGCPYMAIWLYDQTYLGKYTNSVVQLSHIHY